MLGKVDKDIGAEAIHDLVHEVFIGKVASGYLNLSAY